MAIALVNRVHSSWAVCTVLALLVPAVLSAGPPALEPPADNVLTEARAIIERMKASDRGPYSRLRWYCNDGTVHPPQPYACAQRGGGRQHGEYSADRERLSALGWSVGTVFAALGWDEFWNETRRNQRLRELPLERYMIDIDDGWVLRKARFYRGRVQVEDEEAAGRALLTRLLSAPAWVKENYLVTRELVRAVPHHGGEDRTRLVRRLSQELAEKDGSFERLRIKIHTVPGSEDIDATRQWLARARERGVSKTVTAVAENLLEELEGLYGGGADWAAAARKTLAGHPAGAELLDLLESGTDLGRADVLARRSQALAAIRDSVSSSAEGARNLELLDLSLAIERDIGRMAFELIREARTRQELLDLARHLSVGGYGSGFLSERERQALVTPLSTLRSGGSTTATEYAAAVRHLRRAAPWAMATVRFSFAEPLARYSAVDPRALRFVDDLLRSSPLLPLAEVTRRLTADADQAAAILHRIFGQTFGGSMGLNPGVAIGPLRPLFETGSGIESAVVRTDIVVLPETVSELRPVAGILTLAEGNLLSHVQLLARNLGIPNASLTPRVAAEIATRAGRDVLLAVGSDGSVVLEEVSELPPSIGEMVRSGRSEHVAAKLEAPQPDLSFRAPLGLDELSAVLAGRVVGPKAANLGELARLFPGRVEEAIALPFGIFLEHTSSGEPSPRRRLERAFASFRSGDLDEAALASEVEAVRLAVEGLAVSPDLAERLEAVMAERFGSPGSYGVFVRSDTNVEDLPGFTGAGLNLTIANVVGVDQVLATIPRVWASAYGARAMAWRSTILARPEDVYSSVLLMKSVPAEKSGVMVTADLATRGSGLTIACAWGVGGAVDGEAAETIVLRPDGSSLLVAEAKAPYRRRLKPEGGVEWVAAPAGRVLTPEERLALRRLADEVSAKLKPARGKDGKTLPWDIEFGFVNGALTLFQIRPLIERGEVLADRVVAALSPAGPAVPAAIDLASQPTVDSQGN